MDAIIFVINSSRIILWRFCAGISAIIQWGKAALTRVKTELQLTKGNSSFCHFFACSNRHLSFICKYPCGTQSYQCICIVFEFLGLLQIVISWMDPETASICRSNTWQIQKESNIIFFKCYFLQRIVQLKLSETSQNSWKYCFSKRKWMPFPLCAATCLSSLTFWSLHPCWDVTLTCLQTWASIFGIWNRP